MALTRRQREVLDVIRRFIEERRYSPSLEEIGQELGLSSVATVHKHVSHLVDKGFVRRSWNQNRSIELAEEPVSSPATLPLSGTIAAGLPLETTDHVEAIGVPPDMVRRPESSYVLRVQGQSMIEEQIRDGDFVVIEQTEQARNGETVVALIDESEATLKQFYDEGERIRLQPANVTMDPIYVDPARLRIQGVVIGVIRKY